MLHQYSLWMQDVPSSKYGRLGLQEKKKNQHVKQLWVFKDSELAICIPDWKHHVCPVYTVYDAL